MTATLPDRLPSPGERRRALETRVGTWRSSALHGVFDTLTETFSARPLVITDDVTLTYGAVSDMSRRLAAALYNQGVRPEDRVALIMANFPDYVPIKIAIARLGAVAVPLNYLYRAAELRYVLRQSRANVLITMSAFTDQDYLALLDEVAPGWEAGNAATVPNLRQVIVYDTGHTGRAHHAPTVAELFAAASSLPTPTMPAVNGADLGDIVYTSGTTGRPKGVMVSHDAFLRSSYATALTRAFEDGRRVLFSAPLFHMFSYVEAFLAALWTGGAVIPQLTFSPAGFLQGIERHQASEIVTVPTMTVGLIQEAEQHEYDLRSLVAIMSAAAPAPVWLWQKCRSVLGVEEIMTGYGMTESGAGVTMTRPENDLELVSTTVGSVKYAGLAGLPDQPDSIAELRTVDPVNGQVLSAGAEGELVIRSPILMSGFWEKPDETAAVFDGTWLHTGDVGRIRADGFVELTGRTKELYKSGGELVMPKEVEEIVGRIEGVDQVFVLGLPDEKWGEIGCAVVVRQPGVSLESEDVLAACRAQLARFKVPKRVVFMESGELPMTPSGKIQKFQLRQDILAQDRDIPNIRGSQVLTREP